MIDPDQETQEWLDRVAEELPPLIRNSAATIQIAPGDNPDPKVAVELGYTLLLGKPLIVAVPPGRQVPAGVIRAADAIVEWSDDARLMQARLEAAIDRVLP